MVFHSLSLYTYNEFVYLRARNPVAKTSRFIVGFFSAPETQHYIGEPFLHEI